MEFRSHHVAISVRDLAASIEFYGLFGFEPVFRMDDVDLSIVHLARPDGLGLEVFRYPENEASPALRVGAGNDMELVGVKHFAFDVDDVHAVHGELVAPRSSGHGGPARAGRRRLLLRGRPRRHVGRDPPRRPRPDARAWALAHRSLRPTRRAAGSREWRGTRPRSRRRSRRRPCSGRAGARTVGARTTACRRRPRRCCPRGPCSRSTTRCRGSVRTGRSHLRRARGRAASRTSASESTLNDSCITVENVASSGRPDTRTSWWCSFGSLLRKTRSCGKACPRPRSVTRRPNALV